MNAETSYRQQMRNLDLIIARYEALRVEQKQVVKSTNEMKAAWLKSHAEMSGSFGKGAPEGGTADDKGALVGSYAYAADEMRGMSREAFEEWITRAREASELTRTMFSASISAIGDGIAEQLVEGTYEWRDAWKAVLKQIIATAAQLLIVRGLMAALTGGMSSGGGVLSVLTGGVFHRGGLVESWPRHHRGVFAYDEHPAILQRGEYVVRKQAVQAVGRETLDALNRDGRVAGGSTFNVSIRVEGGDDARRTAERIAEPLLEILRREADRNRRILP
ncbi:MAG TPA: phage tail tape measure C-terminal domain-containing protein [bacterium]|nr:phage tail tape measure C-terminal domain-containing protein [bacterium]